MTTTPTAEPITGRLIDAATGEVITTSNEADPKRRAAWIMRWRGRRDVRWVPGSDGAFLIREIAGRVYTLTVTEDDQVTISNSRGEFAGLAIRYPSGNTILGGEPKSWNGAAYGAAVAAAAELLAPADDDEDDEPVEPVNDTPSTPAAVAEHALRTAVMSWEARATSYDLTDPEDRVTFRTEVADAAAAIRVSWLREVARALGVEHPDTSRGGVVRQITKLLIDRQTKSAYDAQVAGIGLSPVQVATLAHLDGRTAHVAGGRVVTPVRDDGRRSQTFELLEGLGLIVPTTDPQVWHVTPCGAAWLDRAGVR